MSADIEKNLGEQPIARLMVVSGLKPHDLVSHSDEQLTHKMVTRAMKGRRLTPRAQTKVLNALNNAAEKEIKVNLEISKEKITLMASRIELRRLFFNTDFHRQFIRHNNTLLKPSRQFPQICY